MVLFLVSAVVYAVATYAQTYLVGWVGQRTLQDLRLKLFVHLQALSIGFYSRNRAGVIISRMTNDVEALDQLVEDGLATLIQSSLTLLGVVVILLVLDFHLALLTFLVLPILALGGLAFRIASADAYRLTREKIASITGYLQETLSGVRVVRAFGQERQHIAAFPRAQRREPGGQHDHGAAQRRLLPGGRAAVGAGHGGDPGDRRDRGDQRPHVDRRRVRLHRRAEQLLRPDPAAVQLYTTYQSGMAALDKIFGLLDEQPELVDAPDATELPPIRGELRFDHVSFKYGYEDEDPWALRDIDLADRPGETVALVGETGRRQVDLRQAGGPLL